MNQQIPPNPKALQDALSLSEEILADIELNRVPLSSVALKTSRLARLFNDFDMQKVMAYEASGYPANQGVMTPESWRLSGITNRRYIANDISTGEKKEYAYLDSIEHLEQQLDLTKAGVDAATDPDISLTSANPNQFLSAPTGNTYERQSLRNQASQLSQRLASRRAFIHQYASKVYYELKFSGVASEIFSRIRNRVDGSISSLIPDSTRRFSAVYENLESENPENWSNAVHSCRRIIEDLANAVFPPQDKNRVLQINGRKKSISLGAGNYINRIMCFVDDNSDLETTSAIIGSHLSYLGDRLDALVSGAQKGTHSDITSMEEADRIVVHTYLLVGDILSIKKANGNDNA